MHVHGRTAISPMDQRCKALSPMTKRDIGNVRLGFARLDLNGEVIMQAIGATKLGLRCATNNHTLQQ